MRVPQSLIRKSWWKKRLIRNVLVAEEVVQLENKIVHAEEEVDGHHHVKEKGDGVEQKVEVAEGAASPFPQKGEKMVPLAENCKLLKNSQKDPANHTSMV